VREAAEGMLTDPRRRELHRVIGAAMDNPHEAAWHLACGAEEPDEDLAKRLDLAAEDAAARGAPARSAALARAAVGLTPDQDSPEGWHRRMTWLAGLTAAGEFDQGRRTSKEGATRIPGSWRAGGHGLRAARAGRGVEQERTP